MIELLLNYAKENGIISVKIADNEFFEANTGVLSSEKNYAKIRVPQELLNEHKKYTVSFRKTIKREAYYSQLAEPSYKEYEFKPLLKTNDINIYHLADVHYKFELAKKTAKYFKDDLDLYIINGDIGEVETLNNYYDVIEFVGYISEGSIPVIFSRGNHDTRGKLAELYTNYFPSNYYDTYYYFDLGVINGVVLDCGEDKPDKNIEYGGVNRFEAFRRRETEFLKSLNLDNKFTFAVSHICPSHTARVIGNTFDIEKEVYKKWNNELDRLNIKFMISAHMHKTYILNKTTEKSTIEHNYPVIVGSGHYEDDIWGTALTISNNKLFIKFTDSNNQVREELELDFNSAL